ncbi:C-C motif chemokine 4-like [Cyprinus carpio]|uniref:Chemokine interleukin-8-like domain-containing protein n=2 Tax=Cyprinus carpio TaxID=7962 RepID=A0A8C1HU16_CYPCA|nr:C-C motif chemokine 4-like [Cyprinus carpio]
MRILMSLLLLVLFCSLQLTSSAPHALESSSCCVQFYKNKIPLKLVVSFYRTRSNCPISAIVFRTAAGREFCLDPDSSWVNSHIAKVNSRTTTATTTKTLSTTV